MKLFKEEDIQKKKNKIAFQKKSKLSQLKKNKILFQKISRKHFYLLFEF